MASFFYFLLVFFLGRVAISIEVQTHLSTTVGFVAKVFIRGWV